MAKRNNYTVSITDNRRQAYPNACKIIEEKQNHLSNMLLGALETVINQNGLQDKPAEYVEWAIEGIRLKLEGGGSDG